MPMRRGPSPHLTWAELACHDRIRTPYPLDWRTTRAAALAHVFEGLRAACGNRPFRVLSAYRTSLHNRKVGGVPSSQHVQGRALDLAHEHLSPEAVAGVAAQLAATTHPEIGGIGVYPTFVHVDIGPRRDDGGLRRWRG